MSYLVTARKWRPMVFEDVVGQSHITTTLKNAIAAGRISHAYLFSGPRGVGKTTTARIFAKAINCHHPIDSNPDNTCELCREITEGRSVNVFEIDGASNRGVEDVRNLRDAVRYAPAKGAYKVYIIDEVHMLTKEAFNALLKTLEEPPSYVVFVFATTEVHKVPLTILSRCQRFDFRRISTSEIIQRLKFIATEERITIDPDESGLFLIAKRSDGSMRDAQSIFDQVVSFSGESISGENVRSMLNIVDEELYFRITDIVRARDVKAGLLVADEVIRSGVDLREFLGGLTEHFRNLLVARTTKSSELIEASETYRARYLEQASIFSESDLLRLIALATSTDAALRWSAQPRIKVEFGLLQMIKMDSSVEISRLLDELEELKKSLNGKKVNGSDEFPFHDVHPEANRAMDATPLKGSVKASQPTLRADQVVSPAAMASSFEPSIRYRTVAPTAIPDAVFDVRSSTGSNLSAEEAHGKWQTFVEEARRQAIAVGTWLSESQLLGVTSNRLQVGCPDDFHIDALKRNRQFLTELAQKIYGARVQLETILAAHTPVHDTPTVESKSTNSIHQHPIVQALVREFGAKEVA